MPRPALRTRSKKRKSQGLPGGQHKTKYLAEKVSGQKCSKCYRKLTFQPRSTSKIRNLTKTKKRISRTYGGQLCPSCLRNLLMQESRVI